MGKFGTSEGSGNYSLGYSRGLEEDWDHALQGLSQAKDNEERDYLRGHNAAKFDLARKEFEDSQNE